MGKAEGSADPAVFREYDDLFLPSSSRNCILQLPAMSSYANTWIAAPLNLLLYNKIKKGGWGWNIDTKSPLLCNNNNNNSVSRRSFYMIYRTEQLAFF